MLGDGHVLPIILQYILKKVLDKLDLDKDLDKVSDKWDTELHINIQKYSQFSKSSNEKIIEEVYNYVTMKLLIYVCKYSSDKSISKPCWNIHSLH